MMAPRPVKTGRQWWLALAALVGLLPGPAHAAQRLGVFNFRVLDGGERRSALTEGIPGVGKLDVRVVRQAVSWGCLEPAPGATQVADCRQIQQVEDLLRAGYQVQINLRTNRLGEGSTEFWATGAPGQKVSGDVSFAPRDMSERWSDQHGHSRTYYDLVRKVLDHFCGRGECKVNEIVVENEANSSHFWRGRDGTPEGDVADYLRLVKTAKKAVRDSGHAVQVFDSGLQGFTVLWVMIADAIKRGDGAAAEAIHRDGFGERVSAAHLRKTIDKKLQNPSVLKSSLLLKSDLYQVTDGLNFHHYNTPESVPGMVDFLRRHAPGGKRIISNEAGLRSEVLRKAGYDSLPDAMFQKVLLMLASGVDTVIWFSPEASENAGMLVSNEGKLQVPTAKAFHFLASLLNGTTVSPMDSRRAGGAPGGVRLSGATAGMIVWDGSPGGDKKAGCADRDVFGAPVGVRKAGRVVVGACAVKR